MFWFKRKPKKLYLLTWSYGMSKYDHYSDFIVARDIAEAWQKHKAEHPIATYCIKIEEIESR